MTLVIHWIFVRTQLLLRTPLVSVYIVAKREYVWKYPKACKEANLGGNCNMTTHALIVGTVFKKFLHIFKIVKLVVSRKTKYKLEQSKIYAHILLATGGLPV